MIEGEFKKRIKTTAKAGGINEKTLAFAILMIQDIEEAQKEFPTIPIICTSERTTFTEYRLIHEKLIQPFLVELRQFKKKWFGED